MATVTETSLDDFEPLVPCQKGIMEARGYVKIDGKWTIPDVSSELTDMRMRPRSMGSYG